MKKANTPNVRAFIKLQNKMNLFITNQAEHTSTENELKLKENTKTKIKIRTKAQSEHQNQNKNKRLQTSAAVFILQFLRSQTLRRHKIQ